MNLFVDVLMWTAYILSLYFSIFLLLVFIEKRSIFKKKSSSIHLTKKPFVTILVPAYNEEKTIIKTLTSINQLDYPKKKLQVIVINDGSQDKTKEIVESYIKDKKHFTLLSHENKGKAASLNRALEKAQGEFFACLDADSFVDKLTLKKMLSFYYQENDPKLAIITPAMKVFKPKEMIQKVQWLEYLVIILFSRLTSHLDSLYVAPGPFSLYQTKIIRELGGFDETNITEDQEIAYRVQKHQYKIKQCFDGYVYTVAPRKIRPFYSQRRRWYLGSLTCLYKYRNMLANKKYGDFGMMQMIKNGLGYLLAITGITLAVYIILIPVMRWIKNLIAINFNIIPYFKNIKFNFDLITFLSTDFRKAGIIILLFCIGLFFFYQAHKNANEKIMKLGWFPLIPYFFFYYILKGVILILSLIEFSKSKKIKW